MSKKSVVRGTFKQPILGTASNNEDLFRDFIASKAPDAAKIEEEIEALGVEGVVEKGMTVFTRNEEGKPCIWDYQIKGFFKDACSMLKKVPGAESAGLKAFKKEIDGLIFVSPRKIIIETDKPIGSCQRPLRAQTPQGERIALAMSEAIAAGATCEFQVTCLKPDLVDKVLEWLDYGELRGFGQWRNSGMGKFSYEILERT